ncbi:MAG: hypothetical protein JWN30_2180, partial [Bacilli bacterium]|nr:hypothetical protein [Bacilli bacterium]
QEEGSLTLELLSRSHTQLVKLILPSTIDSQICEEIELVSGHSVRMDFTFNKQ